MIVGGGPVGVGLAVALGLRGITCAVIERRTELQNIPKGQNLTSRTLEHFYFWGVVDELRAARIMPKGYPISSITAYGTLLSDYWYSPSQREIVRKYYYQDVERLPQYLTELVLRNRLAGLPNVENYFGWGAETIEQDDAGVRVTIAERDGPGREVLEADYLVGCDGSHSLVRGQVGIARAGTDFDQMMLLAVFRSRELHKLLERFPQRGTYNVLHPDLEGYWQFFAHDVGGGFLTPPCRSDATVHGPPAGASRRGLRLRLGSTVGFGICASADTYRVGACVQAMRRAAIHRAAVRVEQRSRGRGQSGLSSPRPQGAGRRAARSYSEGAIVFRDRRRLHRCAH